MNKLNLNHLHYFYHICQTGRLTGAAKSLGISQETMSQQMKVFQEKIGVNLIEADGRTKKLTAAGKEIESYCDELFMLIENIERVIERHKNKQAALRLK
jgi:LysR family transcriptional regulator, transcriptional activator of nhaA